MISKDIANVLASSSEGNCVIYHKSIAVDMGITYLMIKPFVYNLQLVLISHCHSDHLNSATIKKLTSERPTLRFGIGEYLLPYFEGTRNVDVLKAGLLYDYGTFQIRPVSLYHDVPNMGFKIYKNDYKIFHATDTKHLDGITAPDFDVYAIESNYDADTIQAVIDRKEDSGQYSYEKAAINSHLSEQAARDFIFKNKGLNYEVLRLHESKII
jgi:phosphoribosyl 1,2-cyclic phosphodiesterase